MVFAKLLVVVHLCRGEGHCGNGPVLKQLTGQGDHVRTNHQRIRRLSHLRIAYRRLQRQRLLAYFHVDNQRVAVHAGLHLLGLDCGLLADAVVLNHVSDVAASAGPVGKTRNTLQGVGQFADNG